MSKLIPLCNRKSEIVAHTIVDDALYPELSQHRCSLNGHGYPSFSQKTKNGWKQVAIHRYVLRLARNERADHINRNKLDNRSENLRRCSVGENAFNRSLNRNNSTGYKGVTFHKARGKFHSSITTNHKRTFLGLFDDPVDAAKAYDRAARIHHGNFASLNFPQEQSQ